MPTYDYECGKCGDRTEQHHKMTEDPTIFCNHCIATLDQKPGLLHKIIVAPPAFVFKGGKPTP